MNNCERLKEAIDKTGLKVKELKTIIGLSDWTIYKLLRDENTWNQMSENTKAVIQKFIDDVTAGNFKADQPVNKEKKKEKQPKVINKTAKPKVEKVHKQGKESNDLMEQDYKVLTLVEFAYDGLKEAKDDSDFVANIALMKRILSKY